jgi:formate dehydrogenase major subunit
MSLIRKTSQQAVAASRHSAQMVGSLARSLQSAIPMMDRRTFLKRSGVGVGVGLAASQLTLVQKAKASVGAGAKMDGKGKIEVKRTVCSHCSVG